MERRERTEDIIKVFTSECRDEKPNKGEGKKRMESNCHRWTYFFAGRILFNLEDHMRYS